MNKEMEKYLLNPTGWSDTAALRICGEIYRYIQTIRKPVNPRVLDILKGLRKEGDLGKYWAEKLEEALQCH